MTEQQKDGMWDWGNGPTDLNQQEDFQQLADLASEVSQESETDEQLTPEQKMVNDLVSKGAEAFSKIVRSSNAQVQNDPTLTRIWVGFVDGDPQDAVSRLIGYEIDPRRILAIDQHWTFQNGNCFTREINGQKHYYGPDEVKGIVAVRLTEKELIKVKISSPSKQSLIEDPLGFQWIVLSVAMASKQDVNDDQTNKQMKIGPVLMVIDNLATPKSI
ncbi:hypothetical protein F4U94_22785 [Sphingobium limneticum]|uniref:hypothetical protein n=1 Tax=Sphingobium limneticum TaxID=1007511 RepID=UPI00123D1E9D|nr:hypothetical protein [Sphingobium limneticum]KAA9009653.1 hypothetical protein F4U94_22785 [Sphingobium limneticum]